MAKGINLAEFGSTLSPPIACFTAEASGSSPPPIFGLIEFVLHWLIDLAKGKKMIGFHLDQSLHLGCKLTYALIIGGGFAS